MNYADLTEQQRAVVDASVQRAEAKRQARDLKRAETLGRMAAAEDAWNARMGRLAARERAAGRL